jgi:hypothetical protein
MPIAKSDSVTQVSSAKPRTSQHAHSVHGHTQKSVTLNRRYVKPTTPAKKPAAVAMSTESNIKVTTTPRRSAATPAASVHKITRFAKHPSDITVRTSHKKPTVANNIAPATVHPMVQRVAAAAPSAPVATVPKPSHIIKQEAIEKSLSESVSTKGHRHRDKAAKHPAKVKHNRVLRFASVGVALFIVAGYFTYLSMPNLSVRVAAAQAGIDASYPSYRPSGYSLSGPVAFNDGEVSMKFAMNGGNQNFTLTQEKSGWDSAAVQSNYVIPAAGAEYDVTQSGGLTIFRYGKDAAWVNDNILYTIKGDASLTPDQIQRIATSL